MAWWKTRNVWLTVVLGVMVCGISQAQEPVTVPANPANPVFADRTATPDATRLLNFDGGLAILGSALEIRHRKSPRVDCSHLVHAIYEQAGFPYTYASSSDLYEGVPEFRQVTSPQPGDLAVWRGHVAVVINPAQRSFFSSTRSGYRVETYYTGYWKNRGLPRFFRYLRTARSTVPPVLAKKVNSEVADSRAAELQDPPDAEDMDMPDDSPDTSVSMSASQPVNRALPRTQIVNSSQPKTKQVSDALLQTFSDSEKALQGQDVFKLPQSLVIFERLEVKAVHVKGHEGWAEIKITDAHTLAGWKMTSQKGAKQQRWPMVRRENDEWELTLPQKMVYLPRDLGVRILARQLVTLTDSTEQLPEVSKEKAELARALNVLLVK